VRATTIDVRSALFRAGVAREKDMTGTADLLFNLRMVGPPAEKTQGFKAGEIVPLRGWIAP